MAYLVFELEGRVDAVRSIWERAMDRLYGSTLVVVARSPLRPGRILVFIQASILFWFFLLASFFVGVGVSWASGVYWLGMLVFLPLLPFLIVLGALYRGASARGLRVVDDASLFQLVRMGLMVSIPEGEE